MSGNVQLSPRVKLIDDITRHGTVRNVFSEEAASKIAEGDVRCLHCQLSKMKTDFLLVLGRRPTCRRLVVNHNSP